MSFTMNEELISIKEISVIYAKIFEVHQKTMWAIMTSFVLNLELKNFPSRTKALFTVHFIQEKQKCNYYRKVESLPVDHNWKDTSEGNLNFPYVIQVNILHNLTSNCTEIILKEKMPTTVG